jgi:hypothetical protein
VKLVNLTPHTITVFLASGVQHTIRPRPVSARCAVQRVFVDEVFVNEGGATWSVPIYRAELGAVEGLPAPVYGVRYIVSRAVAEAARDREDLLVPDDLVRDAQGTVVGCRKFARV